MSFKTQIEQDASVFLNTDEFAETIEYVPVAALKKSIPALIVREELTPAAEERGRVLQRQVEIYVSSDAAQGIESVTVSEDKALFPATPGGGAVEWRVVEAIGKSGGMWHLRMQR